MLYYIPEKKHFAKQVGDANVLPVYCSLLSDQLTPVSAFERLSAGSNHAFLLESVVGGENIARYSFLGADPIGVVEARDGRTAITGPDGQTSYEQGDPLEHLERTLAQFRAVHPTLLPRFLGGAVGYAGYDVVRQYERLGTPPADDRDLPDLQFGI